MTEQELVEFGFDKVEVSDDESQNGYDYYYYILDLLPGLSLISSANDESSDDEWKVYNFDCDTKSELILIVGDVKYIVLTISVKLINVFCDKCLMFFTF
jgi:hypothetical protein